MLSCFIKRIRKFFFTLIALKELTEYENMYLNFEDLV